MPTNFINKLNKAIAESVVDCNSFELSLQSIGTFGKSKPKILWIGIKENHALEDIYNKVNRVLKTLGLDFNEKEFHPHLTLGRIKNLHSESIMKAISEKFQPLLSQHSSVSEICLFESELRIEGPRYTVLQSHKLR